MTTIDYVSKIERLANEKVWMPAQINQTILIDKDGNTVYDEQGYPVITGVTVENLMQGSIVNEGPKRGSWKVKENGERVWHVGQHNVKRQRDPRAIEETILGTKLMNQNPRVEIEGEEKTNAYTGKTYVQPTKEIVQDAKPLRYGKWIKKSTLAPTPQNRIFEQAAKKAAEVLKSKQFLNSNSTAQPTSTEAESMRNFVA